MLCMFVLLLFGLLLCFVRVCVCVFLRSVSQFFVCFVLFYGGFLVCMLFCLCGFLCFVFFACGVCVCFVVTFAVLMLSGHTHMF